MKMEDKADEARNDILQQYVSDMIAVEHHIAEAVKRQTNDNDLQKHSPEAGRLIQNIAQMTQQHQDHLKQHLTSLGGDPGHPLKEAATTVLGALAGIYDKMRNETVSKMLRDDYTALNLAAVSYTMLHTTGLALRNQTTADLALRHLEHYAQIIMQINQIMPRVVVDDLRNDVTILDEMAAAQAMTHTQQAWQPSQMPSAGLGSTRPM